MDAVRIFTVAEANELIPWLCEVMAEQRTRLANIAEHVEALRRRVGDAAPTLKPTDDETAEVRKIKASLQRTIVALRLGTETVEETGAVVKDLKHGIVDFQARLGTRRVWLCWRAGEPKVAHWHDLDDGFAARHALERLSLH